MQIGLVKGRFFDSSDADGTSPSIFISQTMARQVLSGEDPIGKKLRLGELHSVGTIIGIVNDIKMYYLRERPRWHIYVPVAQFPPRTFGFVVRSSGDPTIMATAIRDAIWAVGRDQPISSVEPLENLIAVVNTGDRVVADLMVFFSVLAMFLGAIGIYGVMAHLVSQRIHEFGIRMALGASPVHVMRMVLSQGLKLALGGVGADRKSTRLNSSHTVISYAVFCLKKKSGHNPLTPGERELIAAFVSGANSCRYCHCAHYLVARAFGVDGAVLASSLVNNCVARFAELRSVANGTKRACRGELAISALRG